MADSNTPPEKADAEKKPRVVRLHPESADSKTMKHPSRRVIAVRIAIYTALAVSAAILFVTLEQGRKARERQPLQTEDKTALLLQQREKARGASRPHEYLPDSTVRITTWAAARREDGVWLAIAPDTLLKVHRTRVETDENNPDLPWEAWITAVPAGGLSASQIRGGTLNPEQPVELHSTFLQAWNPTAVDGMLEIAAQRLVSDQFMGRPRYSVHGAWRNISSDTLTGCVVSVKFLAEDGKLLLEKRTEPVDLPSGVIRNFATQYVWAKFDTIAVDLGFTDAKGNVHRLKEPIYLAPLPPAPSTP